ncbi:hypothetical protein [Streptomyces swartbergensis]|uniref:Uncharacterized protein n=1 Tax=Streptomyces swartbergensis TaxID=487165 RepID=A0A243S9K8_9ACTN|nr:hypothetical protein [Streptomyces swartbergensis]OUD03677.1 hypothetical protein CA983_08365 [Streptomyces swartbergensis]
MTAWRRLRRDLRGRRNLDVYATIAVALGTSIFAAIDLAPTEKIMAAVLAVLAVLAFSTLATRTMVEDLARSGASGGVRFLSDFPEDIKERRERSTDLYLIGVSLSRTLETSHRAFETTLSSGGRIRILLTDPDADNAAVTTQNRTTRPRPDEIRDEIRQSLRLLQRLHAETGGRLEVRTTRTALKFGLNYLDVHRANALLCVQLYSFDVAGESRPIFTLTLTDDPWFEIFREQAERLWDASQPVLTPQP